MERDDDDDDDDEDACSSAAFPLHFSVHVLFCFGFRSVEVVAFVFVFIVVESVLTFPVCTRRCKEILNAVELF